MPPRLSTVLASLSIRADFENYASVESLLGGSFSGLSEIRRDSIAKIDATDLTAQEVQDWLSGLPISQLEELQVAWVADRLGAQMSFETFTANVDDLWYPSMDDIVSVLRHEGDLMVLVLDHEEFFTLSRVKISLGSI